MGFFACLKKGWCAFVQCFCDDCPPAKLPASTSQAPLAAKTEPAAEAKVGSEGRAIEPVKEAPKPPPEPPWEELSVKGDYRYSLQVSKPGKITQDQLKTARAKAERRAQRYWQGKEVRHRVVRKNDTEVEFSFFRRSYDKGPVNLIVRREKVNVTQVGSV
jgi:hypothetical protein